MATEEQRENRLRLLEDHIGRSLTESERSGELRSARSFGKPLDLGDGYDQTPAELRMPFKMLKDSGFAPPEISLMRDIQALREAAAAASAAGDVQAAGAQRLRLAELQQQLAMRLERLRQSGTL